MFRDPGKWWHRVSLKTQQLVLFAIVISAVVILTSVVVIFSTRYSDVFGTSLSRYFAIHRLRYSLSISADHLNAFIRTGSSETLGLHYESRRDVREHFKSVERQGGTSTGSEIEIRATGYGIIASESAADAAIQAYRSGEPGYYFVLERANRYYGYIDSYLERLFGYELESGQERYQTFLDLKRSIQFGSFSAVAAIALVLILFGLGFSRTITLPIAHLAEAAEKMATGNLDHPYLEPPSNRELHVLTTSFSTMNVGIRELVKDLQDKQELQKLLHEQELTTAKTQRLLREAQLEALQAQINPHFLFNTLNSIARTAKLEDAQRSNKLILSLSTVLRYILRNPGRTVSLKDELTIIEEYLHLHQVRFPNRLQYEITVDDDITDLMIPRLTLQPLVENAIKYGIEPHEEGGIVSVSGGRIDRGEVKIMVTDNGAGMSSSRLAHVKEQLKRSEPLVEEGLGLENVYHRLSLVFGSSFQMKIESRENAGTSVALHIPQPSKIQ